MNYYRRYVGDYLRDTSRLSMLEHGAYNLLLDYYYAEEGPIPLDLDEVYRLVRALLPEERAAVIRVLTRYFVKTADGYRNSRADEEISKGVNAIEQMSEAGKRGAEIRWGNRVVNGVEHGAANAGSIRVLMHPPTTNHQPPAANLQPPVKAIPAYAGSGQPAAVPPCPHAEIINLYAEYLPMGRQVKPPWKGTRATHLQARWREDLKRQSLGWWQQFFEHCSKSPFLTGRVPPRRPGNKPFEVSIDWIVDPTNFQKIIEGAYDD